jgi:hypothetical protein
MHPDVMTMVPRQYRFLMRPDGAASGSQHIAPGVHGVLDEANTVLASGRRPPQPVVGNRGVFRRTMAAADPKVGLHDLAGTHA